MKAFCLAGRREIESGFRRRKRDKFLEAVLGEPLLRLLEGDRGWAARSPSLEIVLDRNPPRFLRGGIGDDENHRHVAGEPVFDVGGRTPEIEGSFRVSADSG